MALLKQVKEAVIPLGGLDGETPAFQPL